MDLRDQLQNLFPDHQPEPENTQDDKGFVIQSEPLLCKYEKRKGKPTTLVDGYEGTASELKQLAKALQKKLHVGGSVKQHVIILQGDYRDEIMSFLKQEGFKVKRVGG